ncbi:outer membrane beta-barrel protein [Hymenobacter sp. GOD-10R]|uniref:outer membrane beta-barrel protein n=1 Tax=Hymenobacter sp. GOD-10R TaxID=3093922 RepID=UPI002D76D4A9|nr:outer membrane beta-barrel protein [Hymenobacter sp. GOD-10R]WRQ31858.1 outer membrane beta-barrel protein [Hymenobacter sp. GOD-10R]
MLNRHFAFCTFLVSTPLLSWAQSPAVPAQQAPTYRLYVGVGAYTSDHEYWGSRYEFPSTHPVQVTLGYQLRPRLALQLSGASAAIKGSYAGLVPQADGTNLPYAQRYANRSTSLAALARYTFTRTAAHRLQLDGLGGFTLHHFSFDGTGSYPDPNAPGGFSSYDNHSRTTDALFTAGVSVRYRLTTHLEAVADGTVSTSLRALRDVTQAGALGLRYTFGRW